MQGQLYINRNKKIGSEVFTLKVTRTIVLLFGQVQQKRPQTSDGPE